MQQSMRQEIRLEVARQATRWFFRNQNTKETPWGGIANSADQGRYLYEYYPATGDCRAAGIWAQALGIMAMDSLNAVSDEDYDAEYGKRTQSAIAAGRYLLTLQRQDSHNPGNYGGFSESYPGHDHSFPRDGITGALGLCALFRMTGDNAYLKATELFADWYVKHATDADGWPYHSFDFVESKGYNSKSELLREAQGHRLFTKGDWQVGGSMLFYYLHHFTGNRKYLDDDFLPNMEKLMDLYRENPPNKVLPGFHGAVPVSFGNDDFALCALMCAYCVTRNQEWLDTVRERVDGLLGIMDPETGMFPSFGGTFVMGITIKILKDLEEALGNEPDPRYGPTLDLIAENGTKLQAFDSRDVRVNGGFWGQTHFGVSRDRIHQRSTGYATIFYAMMATDQVVVPWYHCLGWGFDPS